ncbi:MAG: CBS domain-containing protein [Anaerolineales bacterium]|nr:CBS domain-containing protein [Anaerolineales bacterium]
MTIARCMKSTVISVSQTATIREVADIFVSKHIRLIPVVDQDKKVLGSVRVHDMLGLAMPDFIQFIADVGYVQDFGAVERFRPEAKVLNSSITTIMKKAVTVPRSCKLLRAYSLMRQNGLNDLLVVSSKNVLIGAGSLEDVSALILSDWRKVK